MIPNSGSTRQSVAFWRKKGAQAARLFDESDDTMAKVKSSESKRASVEWHGDRLFILDLSGGQCSR